MAGIGVATVSRGRWRRFSPTRGERLLLAAAAVGLLHNVDHILRYDHSGWPFRPEVSPFTFSWVAFPLVAVVLALRSRPWLRAGIVAAMFIAVQTAHVVIETPLDQYGVWARGYSLEADAYGAPNLLGVASPLLGVVAAAVAILAGLLLLGATAALVDEARRGGRGR